MSTYIVDKETIDVLVCAAVHLSNSTNQALPEVGLSKLGQDLWNENVRSVSYRYSDCSTFDLPGTYINEEIAPGLTMDVPEWLTPYDFCSCDVLPREVTRNALEDALSSYEYQSCEHPGWEASFPAQFCRGLRGLLGSFPEAEEHESEELTPEQSREMYGDLSRPETIKRIRAALKRRSGKAWSVRGGTGTGWGWIEISSPPARRVGWGYMTEEDCAELAQLLGIERISKQGESVPASSDYRREYIDRAEGREIRARGVAYWD